MRGGRLLAVAAVLVLGLVGCSEEQPASQTLPTTAATAEATPTLEALGPPDLPMPAEAREQTPAGAEAFIRYYMDVYTSAQAGLDATYMDQLSQGCQTCDQLISNLQEDSAAGLSYEGGAAQVSFISATVDGGRAEAAFSITQDALIVRDAQGSERVDLSAPAADLDCGAILTWSSQLSSWIFTQWDVN